MINSSRFKVQGSRFEVRGLRLFSSTCRLKLQTSNLKLIVIIFLLSACSTSTKPNSKQSTSSTKFQQYIIHGEELYLNNCSNCHQKNGTGLGLLYPPLNKSDFMNNHFEEVICLLRHGKEGELIVNGKSFNKQMKGITTLTDLEIAEIATFIYNTWEHERGIVEVQDVSKVLSHCK